MYLLIGSSSGLFVGLINLRGGMDYQVHIMDECVIPLPIFLVNIQVILHFLLYTDLRLWVFLPAH